MLLEAELRGRDDAIDDRQQPCVATAMPAPLDGDGFEAEIDGSQMPPLSVLPAAALRRPAAGRSRRRRRSSPAVPSGLAALVLSVASR